MSPSTTTLGELFTIATTATTQQPYRHHQQQEQHHQQQHTEEAGQPAAATEGEDGVSAPPQGASSSSSSFFARPMVGRALAACAYLGVVTWYLVGVLFDDTVNLGAMLWLT